MGFIPYIFYMSMSNWAICQSSYNLYNFYIYYIYCEAVFYLWFTDRYITYFQNSGTHGSSQNHDSVSVKQASHDTKWIVLIP